MIPFFLAIAAASGMSEPSAIARAIVMRKTIDLRRLPADSRLSAIAVPVRGSPRAARLRLSVSIAINGTIIGRTRLDDDGHARLRAALDDRSLSMRNTIEIAAEIPDCGSAACRAAVAGVRVTDRPRLGFDAPQPTTDFAPLATRYRAGMTVRQEPGTDAAFGALARRALAPLAPPNAGGHGVVIVARRTPRDIAVPIRFDAGPVSLMRRDGATVIAAPALADLTVVQLLRGGDDPVIWVRPGRYVPAAMPLDGGNVAVFGRAGRMIAFSTSTDDRTIRPGYAPGVDADGSVRMTRIRRWILFGVWALASGGLWLLFRDLARKTAADGGQPWAA